MRIRVEGRQPIRGAYHVSGNVNSALALIAASMLTEAPVTLHNIPETSSVAGMISVAESIGGTLTRSGGTLTLHAPKIAGRGLDREIRSGGPLMFVAPILARSSHARITIDYDLSRIYPHLTALRDLGLHVTVNNNVIDIQAAVWDEREIVLMQTSVTATAIVAMLAAALGKRTVIANAASEPHIVDLLHMLVAMGAAIDGIGSNLLTVYGGKPLTGATFTAAPDHVEAASAAAIAALTGGRLTIEGTRRRDMRLIARVYERLGLRIGLDEDAVVVAAHEHLEMIPDSEDVDVTVESSPWPGFPSDLIAMATVIATQSRGTALIHEKLFNNRMLFIDRLLRMGAQIVLCDPHRAIVVGATRLHGEYNDNPDVRTGLAMLGAALIAEGQTTIDNAEVFDHNFEHVIDKFIALGAKIERREP